jgi:hypothetical protein
MKARLIALMLPALALGACAEQHPVDAVPGVHAQRLAPSTSDIAASCSGQSPTLATALPSDGLYVVTATVREIVDGAERPYGWLSAPADVDVSRLTRPDFDGRKAVAACAGMALKTVVVRSGGASAVEYALEVAPAPGEGSVLPADAHRVRGSLTMSTDHVFERVGFSMGGRDFVAYVAADAGPGLERERAHAAYKAADEAMAKGYGTMLPDERPGRTLDDVAAAAAHNRRN